jgi:hypothetical protein
MYDDIVQDWERWVSSPRGGRALRCWALQHPALEGWGRRNLASPQGSDRTDAMQAALVSLAQSGHQEAVQTLIVQLAPGLTGVTWRAWSGRANGPRPFGSMWEARAEVLSAFGETLAAHRLHRRPRRIAANLVLDTHQRMWRAAERERRSATAALRASPTRGAGPEPAELVDGALDLAAAVAAAIDQLTGTAGSRRLSAEVAFRAWILDEPSALIARELGLGRKTVDTRLCRLRAAVRGAQAAQAARTLRVAATAGQAERTPIGSSLSCGPAAQPARRSDGSAPPSSPVGPSCARRQ